MIQKKIARVKPKWLLIVLFPVFMIAISIINNVQSSDVGFWYLIAKIMLGIYMLVNINYWLNKVLVKKLKNDFSLMLIGTFVILLSVNFFQHIALGYRMLQFDLRILNIASLVFILSLLILLEIIGVITTKPIKSIMNTPSFKVSRRAIPYFSNETLKHRIILLTLYTGAFTSIYALVYFLLA